MSYLSTSGNVGFSGIPQNISDASCATQYKMAVEGVQSACGEVTTYSNDGSVDEQTYLPHLNDYYHNKFKIDPNELYTFHDSDVIASEITVSHTEDNLVYNEPVECRKPEVENIKYNFEFVGKLANGEVKEEIKEEVVPNGHYSSTTKTYVAAKTDTINNSKQLLNINGSNKDLTLKKFDNEVNKQQVCLQNSKGSTDLSNNIIPSNDTKISISNNNRNDDKTPTASKTPSETFLDVFKREQMGVMETSMIKVEPTQTAPSIPSTISSSAKTPVATSKKSSSCKSPSASKSRRGRGPALHEALQRISSQQLTIVKPNRAWHAPGNELFECGPLMDQKHHPYQQLEASSSDEDEMPTFGLWSGCVEEAGAEDRGARLALRRAALRRQVAHAAAATRSPVAAEHRAQKALLLHIQKQVCSKSLSARLSTYTVNHLLALRGVNNVLSSRERRRLRECGWSGGESSGGAGVCAGEGCERACLPCAQYCFVHVTHAPEQRLYAPCAAVFAGGARCKQPLLPLHDQTPLCTEHAWKRDNYDKISRECKPKKVIRKRVCPGTPRRAKRRRRPPARPRTSPATATTTANATAPATTNATVNSSQTLSELNVCSNSSAYDSTEETGVAALSENEFIVTSTNTHTLEVDEVGQVPPDDILDPAVLSQIPDEAFTEFFNQSESGSAYVESEELTRALEAVLDERALDSIADCVFPAPAARAKMQMAASVGVEMASRAPS